MKLVIAGFKSAAQVEAFWDWYSGQGEQDATTWFECRKLDGEIDVDTMYSNCRILPVWKNDELHVEVEILEDEDE